MASADISQFNKILEALLATDNNMRSDAEKAYNNLQIAPKVQHLLIALDDASLKEDARLMAAVLLRRLFSSSFQDYWDALSAEEQANLKAGILLIIKPESSHSLRQKLCEVVAEVARNLIDDDGNNQWPEVLQFLFQSANSTSNELRESALRVFTAVPNVFGTQETQYQVLIHQMLMQSLEPSLSFDVQFQAVRAIGAYVLFHEKDSNVFKMFGDLLPRSLAIIAVSIEQQEDQQLLKMLIDLTETCPKYLRPQIEVIFDLCVKVFSNKHFEDSWRHLALEVIVSMSENAPAMVRKHANEYIVAIVPLVLEMMAELEDDEQWAVSEEVNEDDNSDNNVIAESALDRLACGLGGKTVLPHITNAIPKMLSDPRWQYRHAALMAISAIGEGCHKQMETMLDEVVGAVIKFIDDPVPRVRFAACNAIGQMATDFAPVFEKKFHEPVVEGLLKLLDNPHFPRVQAHAGAALVNFSEDCPKHILTKYLDRVMKKLGEILQSKFQELVSVGNKLVLEQVVTTIASVADTTEKEFVVYYDDLMPCLKYMIEKGTSDELRMLRGKTIECVSLIGLAVGPEKFASDASGIMDLLLSTQAEGDLPEDDPQTSYLISAWARMCKILGASFAKYLPLVMPPVMRTAAMKPEVAFLDNDEVEDIEGDVDWSFINLGEQQNFAIRTAGMEDKASACEMLVCYARELKDGFAPYAEEVTNLMVPMLKFYFHDGVRTAAAESLPYLLDSAKTRGMQYVSAMWQYVCPELLKAIGTEPELDVIAELFHALSKCIETLGRGCLSEGQQVETLRLIKKYMDEHFEKSDKRAAARQEEDYDEGVEEKLAEEDDADIYLLSKVADVVHSLFKVNGVEFMPYFTTMVGDFAKLLDPQRPWADRQWGLCIFDDVIEYTGPMCVQYQQYFLHSLFEYTKDKSAEVRQAATYGCGVLAQFGGDQFASHCAQLVQRLSEVIVAPDSRQPENVNPTENAISSVTKILKYNASAIPNLEEVHQLWMSWLPVVEDADEAPHVYGYFCDLITANHPVILGPNNSNLPRIVQIIATAFDTGVVQGGSEIGVRLVAILQQVERNPEVFQACIGVLSADERKSLEREYQKAKGVAEAAAGTAVA